MKRREFITLVGSATAAWPLAARAQQRGLPVIGYFSARSADAEIPIRLPFLRALEETGFVAERNVTRENHPCAANEFDIDRFHSHSPTGRNWPWL